MCKWLNIYHNKYIFLKCQSFVLLWQPLFETINCLRFLQYRNKALQHKPSHTNAKHLGGISHISSVSPGEVRPEKCLTSSKLKMIHNNTFRHFKATFIQAEKFSCVFYVYVCGKWNWWVWKWMLSLQGLTVQRILVFCILTEQRVTWRMAIVKTAYRTAQGERRPFFILKYTHKQLQWQNKIRFYRVISVK